MLIDSIVITGNGARANIHLRTHLAITDITQVIHFTTHPDSGLFGFHKIADAGSVCQHRSGAQSRIRSDTALFTDHRFLQMAHGMNNSAVGHTDITQYAVGTNRDAIAQSNCAFKSRR